MKITTKQLERVFRKLDVELTHSSHHIRGFLIADGKKLYPPVYYSLGKEEIPSFVVKKLRKSFLLTAPEFEQLISCNMSKEQYYKIRSTREPIEYIPEKEIKKQKPKFFISYSSVDEEFADKLYTDLTEVGIDCWFAPHDLTIGDDIKETITEEIIKRKGVVLILSRNSIDSEWVELEVNQAMKLERETGEKVFYPVRIDDAVFDPGSGWYKSIRRKHIGDFRKWINEANYIHTLNSLIKAMQS